MPIVETTTWINAPIQTVYDVSRDNEAFPEFMEDVKSLTVVEREGDTIISDWVGIVAKFGLKVRWRQKDVWNSETFTCEFEQVKGDYDKLKGTWKFREENGGTRFDSTVEYEYVVPGLGALVGQVIYGLVVKNMEATLAAIKRRAESLAP